MPVPWLDPHTIGFPDVDTALDEPNGLLAAGGALTANWLLEAYPQGIFPWFSEGDPILWWAPDPRLVLYPEHLRVSRSLRKFVKNNPYELYINRDFEAVITHCGATREQSTGTWITPDMAAAYNELHRLGFAHSVEVWEDDTLVGGLYGVAVGKVFFGESMFSRVTNASKLALVGLVQQLKDWQFELIDCQISSEHLVSLGAEEISRAQFRDILQRASQGAETQPWPLMHHLVLV